jgi:hypothetical protein
MEGLDKGGQGPISGSCAIEEEDILIVMFYVLWLPSIIFKK